MNTRRWLVSVLVMLLGWVALPPAGGLLAETPRRDRRETIIAPRHPLELIGQALDDADPSDRPSHRAIDTDLADALSPEERLARRLLPSRDLKRFMEDKTFQDNLQALAKKLIQDPKLLESLQKQLSPEDIKKLKKKIRSDQGVDGADQALKKLFDEGKLGKILNPKDEELLKQWAEKLKGQGEEPSPSTNPDGPPLDKPSPGPPPEGPTPDPGDPSGPSWGRLPEEAPDWFKKRIEGMVKNSDWIEPFMGPSWRDTLADLAKRAAEESSQASGFTAGARGLMPYLPKASDFLPRNLRWRPPTQRLPSLPNIRLPHVPHAPSFPTLPGANPSKVVLWVVVLGVTTLLFWRAGGWWRQASAAQARIWKLGPWPVRPGEVSTRLDLVRAFEHLALLCLGQEARTRHHLELADRIGEQPAIDPDRRRQAARALARLYEQARYAPDEERLPPEMMASAQRELSYLAGVGAA